MCETITKLHNISFPRQYIYFSTSYSNRSFFSNYISFFLLFNISNRITFIVGNKKKSVCCITFVFFVQFLIPRAQLRSIATRGRWSSVGNMAEICNRRCATIIRDKRFHLLARDNVASGYNVKHSYTLPRKGFSLYLLCDEGTNARFVLAKMHVARRASYARYYTSRTSTRCIVTSLNLLTFTLSRRAILHAILKQALCLCPIILSEIRMCLQSLRAATRYCSRSDIFRTCFVFIHAHAHMHALFLKVMFV